jgi:non-ribosomal peptide synthetase component F
VRHVKRTAIEAFGHPDVPLEYLQRELKVGHGASATLYQALFSFQDARQRSVDWGGLAHEQILLFQSAATEDLGLWFLESNAGMVGGVTYNADLLQANTARLMRERYLDMIQRVAADPSISVGSLTAATPAEREKMRGWNATVSKAMLPLDVYAMVEAQAGRSPDATAIIQGARATSYLTLLRRALRMAILLRDRGALAGSVVGLCVDPGADRLAGLLAIAHTGSTALLLDRADPAARLRDIVADARMTVMIGDIALEATLDWPRACALWLDADHAELEGVQLDDVPVGAFPEPDALAIAFHVPSADGNARGAALSHRSVTNTVEGLIHALDVQPGQRIGGDALPGDPMSMIEPLLALASGAAWVVQEAHELARGELLPLDRFIATPETWHDLLDQGWTGDAQLQAVIIGGTPTPEMAAQVGERTAGLWTLFGDALSAPVATCGRVDRMVDALHEGRPLPNSEVWMLDDDGEPCPIGATGEVAIAGCGLAVAFGSRALADRQPGDDRLVRTGYRGRWLADGLVQVLDRDDRRIRRHGLDIEPTAIETLLLAQPGIVRALAVPRTGHAGDQRIDAYAVAAPGCQPDVDGVRAALAAHLPAWSMPASLTLLDAMPLLATGEPDVAALPLPAEQRSASGMPNSNEPHTESERLLASVWQELLGMCRVRTSDNFFDVGGHSLLAVDMAMRVQKLTGVQLNLLDIANGTLGTLAADLALATPAAPAASKRGLFSRLIGRG